MSKETKNAEEEKQKNSTSEEDAEVKTEEAEANEAQKSAEKEEVEKEKTPEERIAELEKENAELKDQYLRKVADFDNYRKRMIREKQDAFDYANTNLLTDLITILDNFDRALSAADTTPNADSTAVVDGIRMTSKQLYSLLDSKYNLTSYGEVGDAFDHDKHEAIGSTQAPVAEPVCAQVYLKGYMLKERVIRPAKVMVNMPDGSVEKSQSDDEKTDTAEKAE